MPSNDTSNSALNWLATAIWVMALAVGWNWLTGKGTPDVQFSKLIMQAYNTLSTKDGCIGNNQHLGPDVASQLCTCREQSMRKAIASATTMEQINKVGGFAVSYCEPIAKAYSQAVQASQGASQSPGLPRQDYGYSDELSAQRSRLLRDIMMRQIAESGATMRSMISSNPYASSTINTNGFDLSGIYPSGYSGVVRDGSQAYRVEVTGPETFTVSECRAVDCAY
jgi:hypothetical protein